MKKFLIFCLALLLMLSTAACAKLSPNAVAEKIVDTLLESEETAAPMATPEEVPEETPVDTSVEVDVQMDKANYVILRSDDGTNTGLYEYKSGKLSKISYYNNITTELSSYKTFTYNSAGQLTEECEYEDDGTEYMKFLYEYDDNGNLYRDTTIYYGDTIWSILEYHYDENDRVTEQCILDEDDFEVDSTTIYVYDEKGHLIRHECMDDDGDMIYRTEFICDDMGNWIHEETYFASSPNEAQHVEDYEYVYNEHGQIIQQDNITYEYGPIP